MKVENCIFQKSESIFLHRGWLYSLERIEGDYMFWKPQIRPSIWNAVSAVKGKNANVLSFFCVKNTTNIKSRLRLLKKQTKISSFDW